MADGELKKLLTDLRVVDLKVELEKRDVDTSGVKAVLVKKLHKALVDEGLDPDTYVFTVDKSSPSTPSKQTSKKKDTEDEHVKEDKSIIKEDKPSEKDEKPSENATIEEVITESSAKKEDKNEVVEVSNSTDEPAKVSDTKEEDNDKEDLNHDTLGKKIDEEDKETEKITNQVETYVCKETEKPDKEADKEPDDKVTEKEHDNMEVEEHVNKDVAEEHVNKDVTEHVNKEVEEDQEKETIKDDDIYKEEEEEEPKDYEEGDDMEEADEDSKAVDEKIDTDLNGVDNEDSINLTLGEEDEKLMAGEVDLLTKDSKDLKERGVSRLGSSKKAASAQDQMKKSNTSPDKASEDKDKKSINHRNLWVSGLAPTTRATDLKHLFSKNGKVVAAKVVTNAKTPGARCYGFVTMATTEDVQKCIDNLNLTELHGRLISVEAVANRPTPGAKKPSEDRKKVDEKKKLADDKKKAEDRRRAEDKKRDEKRKIELSPRRGDEKRRKRNDSENLVPPGTEDMADENGDSNDPDKVIVDEGSDAGGGGGSVHGAESDHRSHSSRDKSRERRRSASAGKRAHQNHGILSFSQIKEERSRARATERAREEERRRRERNRAIERKQRDESMRLEREREKIRIERERLERERAELLRLERERLEREKEDLKRQQLKLEEARRNKRTLSNAREGYDNRKRVATETSRHYEAVHMSPSRAEYKKDSRREAVSPGRGGVRYEDPTRASRREDPARVKDRAYSERAAAAGNNAAFRGSERDRRDDGGHRMKSDSGRGSHRDGQGMKGDRYQNDGWGAGVSKNFGSVSGGGRDWNMSQDRKPEMSPWARPPSQSDRWVSSSSMMVSGRNGPGHLYPPGMTGMPSSMGMQLGSGYQQEDRFDAYKTMGSQTRKY